MALKNTREGWGWMARAFHWSVALLILGQLIVGFYMVRVVGDDLIQRFQLTQSHKNFGFLVFALGMLRIAWRLINPTPAEPAMASWQRTASRASHIALYVLMIALPVSGWLMASASPLNDAGAYFQVKNEIKLEYMLGAEWGKAVAGWFGWSNGTLFALPDPFQPGSKVLDEALKAVHFWSAIALSGLLLMHTGAALKHQYIDKDGLLRRMVWGAPFPEGKRGERETPSYTSPAE
ncbi:MAG: cytochrome b [Pseudomonadota bacterium]